MSKAKTYAGGCHCGAIRYQAEIDLSQPVSRCNCSICQKLGRTGAIIKPAAFRLLAGKESLADYQWGSQMGTYHFCKRCGAHPFSEGHLEVLGGDFVSINVNCLDDVELVDLQVVYW